METLAEQIYRSVLAEIPEHPDALHLLGLVFYQRGDTLKATEYVERALQLSGKKEPPPPPAPAPSFHTHP